MVILGAFKTCSNVTIVICNDGAKPFNVEQRREMISAALLAKDIMDANIVVVPDGHDAAWVERVLDECGNPSDAGVWSGDEAVRALFEAQGVQTKKIVPVPGISGEDIRKKMAANDPAFRKHIPSGAIDVVMARKSQGVRSG